MQLFLYEDGDITLVCVKDRHGSTYTLEKEKKNKKGIKHLLQ